MVAISLFLGFFLAKQTWAVFLVVFFFGGGGWFGVATNGLGWWFGILGAQGLPNIIQTTCLFGRICCNPWLGLRLTKGRDSIRMLQKMPLRDLGHRLWE